jgi:bifunctional oligoribonuclease and PAP phosphatase NrnA
MISVWESLHHFIEAADHILVVSHVDPDGDAVSSTLATAIILRAYGKKVTMVNSSPIPKRFLFLPGVEDILQPQQIKEKFADVVTVDCADAKRVGTCANLYTDPVRILNIDHHISNEGFGDVNLVLPDAAATVDILFDWIENMGLAWDRALATIIYTGMLTDTGGFRYSNTTPQLFRKAAQLLEVGIKADRIVNHVLETMTMGQAQLLQMALSNLNCSEDGLIAWMTLRLVDVRRTDVTSEDAEGIVNYARNIAGVDVGILFWEKEAGIIKIRLRSRDRVNVAAVTKQMGGGGHARAAGCMYQGTIEQAQAAVLALLFRELGSEQK